MYQSSNMFMPHSCNCNETCGCHCPCECSCQDPCCEPENYYCAKNHCVCDSPSCCCENSMTHALSQYVGKQIIVCIGNTNMRVLVCGICGNFIKVLSIKCGRTLFINACKINSVKISC